VVFTVVNFQVQVLWVVTLCIVVVGCQLHPEEGGRMDLRNVSILPQHSMCHNQEDLDINVSTLFSNVIDVEYLNLNE